MGNGKWENIYLYVGKSTYMFVGDGFIYTYVLRKRNLMICNMYLYKNYVGIYVWENLMQHSVYKYLNFVRLKINLNSKC